MQLLFDFLPILVFFVAYKLGGMYVATATFMVAMPVLCGITWLRQRKVSTMMLVSTALVLVLGGITLLLRDDAFIKWKLTVVDWLFALGFALAPRFGGQTIVQRLMGAQLTLAEQHWRTLNWMWIGFFLFIGALNVYVMYHYSTDNWMNFKLFGTLGLTLVFVLLQGLWLAGKLPKDGESDTSQPDSPAKPSSDQQH